MEEIYRQMFGRNIGNVTEQEQQKLREAKIAVAGTGGVAGAALYNLVRSGIGSFHIADPEEFAYSDLNRQHGSSHAAVGSRKVEVLKVALEAINPFVVIHAFPEGVTQDNLEKFLEGVSLVVDGLDFFCLQIRKSLYDACRIKRIHVLSCPIFGFGTSLAVFSPDGPSFDEFFGPIPEQIDAKYAINFGRSFFPSFPRYLNLAAYMEAMQKNKPIPSFATSCSLSGAVTAAEAVFIILGKRKPVYAPMIRHYDLFDSKIVVRDSRSKNLGFFKKKILKILLKRRKELAPYKDFVDKL
jgi:sulfur-carrier protein adenylyltransferase/sulfurtransferase